MTKNPNLTILRKKADKLYAGLISIVDELESANGVVEPDDIQIADLEKKTLLFVQHPERTVSIDPPTSFQEDMYNLIRQSKKLLIDAPRCCGMTTLLCNLCANYPAVFDKKDNVRILYFVRRGAFCQEIKDKICSILNALSERFILNNSYGKYIIRTEFGTIVIASSPDSLIEEDLFDFVVVDNMDCTSEAKLSKFRHIVVDCFCNESGKCVLANSGGKWNGNEWFYDILRFKHLFGYESLELSEDACKQFYKK